MRCPSISSQLVLPIARAGWQCYRLGAIPCYLARWGNVKHPSQPLLCWADATRRHFRVVILYHGHHGGVAVGALRGGALGVDAQHVPAAPACRDGRWADMVKTWVLMEAGGGRRAHAGSIALMLACGKC